MNREDFPMLKQDIIYFDNGATSFKPKCVIDKIVDYYSNYSANALIFDSCKKVKSSRTLINKGIESCF